MEDSMKTNTELSIDIMARITQVMNEIITTSGEIQINNNRLWKGMLHQFDNTHWRGMISVLKRLNQQHPEMLDMDCVDALVSAEHLLDRYDAYYDAVLDVKNAKVNGKTVAWKLLHGVRETVCRCWGVDLPNADSSKKTSTFDDLYGDA